MHTIRPASLFLFAFAALLILGALGLSAASDAYDLYAPIAVGFGVIFAVVAAFWVRPPTANKRVVLLAAHTNKATPITPRSSFGEGVVRFIRLEPIRTAMIIRIVFYLATALIYGTVIDPEFLLESLLTAVLGSAADIAKSQDTRSRTVPATVDYELGKLSAAGEVGAFTANLVRSLVPEFLVGATIGKALEAIAPFIGPIAGNALTPDLQKTVTAKVHDALRNAGLIRRIELGGKGV